MLFDQIFVSLCIRQSNRHHFPIHHSVILILKVVKNGYCKIAVVVDNRPRRMRARVDAIGAQTVAGIPRAQYKLLGPAEILNHGVGPVTIGILGGQAEQTTLEFFLSHAAVWVVTH